MSANAFSFEIKLKRENKVYYENVSMSTSEDYFLINCETVSIGYADRMCAVSVPNGN